MYRAVYYFVHVRAGTCARTDILIHPCSAVRVIIINHLSQFGCLLHISVLFSVDGLCFRLVDGFDDDDGFCDFVIMLFSEETQTS